MNRFRHGLVAFVTACLCVVLTVLVPGTRASLTAAVNNTTNQAISGITNGPCTSSATAAANAAYFVWPLDDAPGATSAWDSSRSSRPGTYVNTTQITYGAPGPCPSDNARAVTLSGSASGGYVTSTTGPIAGQQTFSAAIWFKTSTTAGGKLIGFGSSQTGSSGSYDRHLYMTSGTGAASGKIIAGVYPSLGGIGVLNSTRTVTSTASYNDNAWHQAVITLSATTGLKLYVDGVLLGTDTLATTAQVFTGYWRVGYDNLNSWPSSPSSSYFAGSVAFASVYTSALTQTQVTALYNAGR